jgi:hypothetical protein
MLLFSSFGCGTLAQLQLSENPPGLLERGESVPRPLANLSLKVFNILLLIRAEISFPGRIRNYHIFIAVIFGA